MILETSLDLRKYTQKDIKSYKLLKDLGFATNVKFFKYGQSIMIIIIERLHIKMINSWISVTLIGFVKLKKTIKSIKKKLKNFKL